MSLLTAVLLKRVEFRENVRTFLSPGGNQTIRNTKASVRRSLTVLCLVGRLVGYFQECDLKAEVSRRPLQK